MNVVYENLYGAVKVVCSLYILLHAHSVHTILTDSCLNCGASEMNTKQMERNGEMSADEKSTRDDLPIVQLYIGYICDSMNARFDSTPTVTALARCFCSLRLYVHLLMVITRSHTQQEHTFGCV